MHLNRTLKTHYKPMKKICLIALLCLIFIQVKAQDGATFKIKFKPNYTYKSDISVNMKLDANATGDPDIIDKLKSSGITNPITALLDMGFNGVMKTGSTGADNSFPLTMDYKIAKLSVSANGQEAPIPPSVSEKDIKIVGSISQDGVMSIDSAAGKKADDSTKNQMKQMMELFQKKIQFPAKAMKPGESFTQTTPMNLPMGKNGGNINVNYSTTYKLVSISDGKAFFDVVPNFSMDFSIQKIAINMSGTGLGKMVYSIKDNFPISNEGNFTLKLKVTSAKVNVDATGDIKTSSTTVIN